MRKGKSGSSSFHLISASNTGELFWTICLTSFRNIWWITCHGWPLDSVEDSICPWLWIAFKLAALWKEIGYRDFVCLFLSWFWKLLANGALFSYVFYLKFTFHWIFTTCNQNTKFKSGRTWDKLYFNCFQVQHCMILKQTKRPKLQVKIEITSDGFLLM